MRGYRGKEREIKKKRERERDIYSVGDGDSLEQLARSYKV
jgi:Mor family transcriptional regulator